MPSSPYATHLSVLDKLDRPKKVLELGAGAYSTPYFLEHAKSVVSLETSPEWYAWVSDNFENRKLDLRLVEDIPRALEKIDLTKFDLVFVDNGDSAAERGAVIRAVLSKPHPTVVVHDAEVYGGLLNELAPGHEVFRDEEPWTAVVR